MSLTNLSLDSQDIIYNCLSNKHNAILEHAKDIINTDLGILSETQSILMTQFIKSCLSDIKKISSILDGMDKDLQ